MATIVSLRDFVNELEFMSEERHSYVNRKTGEVLCATVEALSAIEEGEEDSLPDWLADELPKLREVVSSGDWLRMPSRFELEEYRIMEDFCGTLRDQTLAADLLDTIGGRGTFGRFKNMLHRHNIHEAWYRFRDLALREFAIEWLEDHGFAYKD